MARGQWEKQNKTWEMSDMFFACMILTVSVLFGVLTIMMFKHSGHPWEQ